MNSNILVTASALSDQDLLARLEVLAGKEREALVELVAHLAALDCRPALYAAQGYGSLFSYCTQALRLSEDAACNRIDAARESARRVEARVDGQRGRIGSERFSRFNRNCRGKSRTSPGSSCSR